MISRIYEIRCDYCGRLLGYSKDRPTNEQIREQLGAIVIGQRHFCQESCAADANHDAAVKRAGNLKQFAPYKSFKRK